MDARTGPVTYASQLDLDSDDESQFLKDAKTGIDLSSPGDLATLKLDNLLTVDGVTLQKVTVGETDKVIVEKGPVTEAPTLVANLTRTTTRGADGSTMVVTKNDITGATTERMYTRFMNGTQIVETGFASADGGMAVITRADGRTVTYGKETGDYPTTAPAPAPATGDGVADGVNRGIVPGALATALADYENSTQAIAQDSAVGYGAWLADSFFLAYTLMSEDDTKRDDPDSSAYKSVFGGRTNRSAMAMDLSGRGSTAMWKGLMVGHDMDKDEATYGNMVKGNASITAQLAPATLADQTGSASGVVSLVDVALTNIINDKGEDARVTELTWTNLDLVGAAPGLDGQDDEGDPMAMAVSFSKGSEITGNFYDDGNEVVGKFNKEDIAGVFGAVEYEMMDMADSQ